jgi:cobalamin biosynthesis Mg chelatase CobN
LLLLGVEPVWDHGSNRVTGIEVTPLATLGRPRVDVTLRISGRFRDAGASQVALFDLAVTSVAARDEPAEDNPLAAADHLGARPALHHLDTSRPEAPKVRSLTEEVARVVRGRAANPAWIAGMMRHGYRGAAEIARTVDALYGFAATTGERFDRQFDLLFEATLADPEVDAFLAEANPAARSAMAARLRTALAQDLWRTRRNDVGHLLEAIA